LPNAKEVTRPLPSRLEKGKKKKGVTTGKAPNLGGGRPVRGFPMLSLRGSAYAPGEKKSILKKALPSCTRSRRRSKRRYCAAPSSPEKKSWKSGLQGRLRIKKEGSQLFLTSNIRRGAFFSGRGFMIANLRKKTRSGMEESLIIILGGD